MAAAFFRRGTGLCVRCLHRELCRVVWRPQTAQFSSKPPDRKQPRRTHIKKARPQPAVDVAKLLEQLFSQHRPGTAPPAARPAKASSMPPKPPATSSMRLSTSNVPLSSKTEPAVSVFPAASSLKQLDSVVKTIMSTFNPAPPSPQPKPTSTTNPKTSYSSKAPQQSPQGFAAASVSNVTVPPTSTAPASLESKAAAIEAQTSAETMETKVETATEAVTEPSSAHVVEKNIEVSSFSAATVEPSIESPVEPSLSPMETLEVGAAVVEGPVKATMHVPAEEVQTKDSGEVLVSHTPTVEPSIETTTESTLEALHFPVEALESRAAVVEGPVEPTTDAETKSTNSGVVDISHTAKVEPLVETTTESPVEASLSPLETLEVKAAVVEGPVEPTIDVTVDKAAEINNPDSAVVNVSCSAKEEPLIEYDRTIEPAVEANIPPLETLESRAAVVEAPVEPKIDVTVDKAAETKSTNSGVLDISHTTTVEPLVETVEPSVEANIPPVETLESRAAVVEPTIDATVDAPAQAVETNSTDSGVVNVSHSAKEEPLIEYNRTIEPAVVASSSPLESRAAVSEGPVEPTIDAPAQAVETNSTDSGVSYNSKEGPLIEYNRTLEATLEATEGPVEPSIESETADGLSHTALIQNAQESAPLALTNEVESTLETTVESGNVAVEEAVNKSEQMTLESVTLHEVQVLVESLKTDELLRTKSTLDEKAEEELQELLVQAGTGAAAESPDEVESEILTKALSEWDSLSEDLQELEGESGTLVKELLCCDPAVLSKTSSASDPPAGANGESSQAEEKEPEAESMTLESITLAQVKAAVGGLETEVLQETRDALEKEAEVLAKEEKVEDVVVFEDTEGDILRLESISEATDAIEVEAFAMLEEAMFGPEQGPRHPPDQKLGQQEEAMDQEALKEMEGAQTEALGTHTELDPVQRLFLEKIREYNNMRRLNEGLLEAEPYYERYLSEETAKLQRLYGGGDLSSFPEFTFTEADRSPCTEAKHCTAVDRTTFTDGETDSRLPCQKRLFYLADHGSCWSTVVSIHPNMDQDSK